MPINLYEVKVKISVIIPCYNMKIYLGKCIDSILSQSIDSLEIICIDDGSSDGTKELLEDYQEKYNNIRFIFQNNEGAGNARNKGIKLAYGEYVAFMDADDFYPNANTLEYLYDMALKNKANVCGGSFCSYRNGVYTYDGFRKGMVFKEKGWIEKKEFPTFAGYWRFLYRRSFLIRNNICFPGYRRAQDVPFFLNAVSKADKVFCVKEVVYCYRKEHKLVKFDESKAVDYIKAIRDSLSIAKNEELNSIYDALISELHGEATALMYYFAHEGSGEMKKAIHDINSIVQNREDNKPVLLEGDGLDKYVEEIWEERKALFEEINKYSKILIYGAGTVGRKVLNFLRDNRYEPDAFIVSDKKQNPSDVEGVRVKSVEEYVNRQDECFILVATFSYLHEEIKKVLCKNGFKSFYLIDLEKFYLWCGGIIH